MHFQVRVINSPYFAEFGPREPLVLIGSEYWLLDVFWWDGENADFHRLPLCGVIAKAANENGPYLFQRWGFAHGETR